MTQQTSKGLPKQEPPKKRKAAQDAEDRLAIDIPEAARRLGIGRNQAYEAAKAGELPTIPWWRSSGCCAPMIRRTPPDRQMREGPRRNR
jgi:hypothetical protein